MCCFCRRSIRSTSFRILNVCHDITRLEHDPDAFQEVIDTIQESDAVLWATPVYVLLVPGPYKRFIELVFARSAHVAFQGKYTAAITTSVRFFDHTAHSYLNAISDDLGMHYVGGYSAEMFDLLKELEQKRLALFFGEFLRATAQRSRTQRRHEAVNASPFRYTPGPARSPRATNGKKLLIVTDAEPHDENLRHMVGRFCASIAGPRGRGQPP